MIQAFCPFLSPWLLSGSSPSASHTRSGTLVFYNLVSFHSCSPEVHSSHSFQDDIQELKFDHVTPRPFEMLQCFHHTEINENRSISPHNLAYFFDLITYLSFLTHDSQKWCFSNPNIKHFTTSAPM